MIRSFLTIVVGILVGSLTVFLLGWVGHLLVPPPAGVDLSIPETLMDYVETAPPAFFLVLLASWAGGAFAGGFAAALLAARQRSWHAIGVGSIQTLLAIFQLVMIPHPTWVAISAVTLFVPFAWLGGQPLSGTPDAAAEVSGLG